MKKILLHMTQNTGKNIHIQLLDTPYLQFRPTISSVIKNNSPKICICKIGKCFRVQTTA